VQNAASTIGTTAVTVGQLTVSAAADLGNELQHFANNLGDKAMAAAEQSQKLGNLMADQIQSHIDALGEDYKKLGSLAAGFAGDAWDGVKDHFSCFSPNTLLCPLLLPQFDCDAGSSIDLDFTEAALRVTGVNPKGDFGKSFGIASSAADLFEAADAASSGKVKLPGAEMVSEKLGKVKDRAQSLSLSQRSHEGLRDKMVKAPAGSCEHDLSLALDGQVELEPVLQLEVSGSGDATVTLTATASASLKVLIEAEGACSFSGERRFPKEPVTKTTCSGMFCIALMIQAVAQIDITGTVTGSVDADLEADFGITTQITVNLADGSVSATSQPTEFNHKEGLLFAAAMDGTIRFGLGPHFVVWPMPGVPVNILPMINAEIKGLGELEWTPNLTPSLIGQGANASSRPQPTTCAGASLNAFATSNITALGLPEALQAGLSTTWLAESVEQAILDGATAMLEVITGPAACIPGGEMVGDAVMSAAETASSAIASAIPDLHVSLPAILSQTITADEVWCQNLIQAGETCGGVLGCD
jgi:hypothetical protein